MWIRGHRAAFVVPFQISTHTHTYTHTHTSTQMWHQISKQIVWKIVFRKLSLIAIYGQMEPICSLRFIFCYAHWGRRAQIIIVVEYAAYAMSPCLFFSVDFKWPKIYLTRTNNAALPKQQQHHHHHQQQQKTVEKNSKWNSREILKKLDRMRAFS